MRSHVVISAVDSIAILERVGPQPHSFAEPSYMFACLHIGATELVKVATSYECARERLLHTF